ncbi:transcriptional regulator, XRE family [Desulfofarcimen acetoxidans DSM 771]|uniref:Transcriptional regulator, XRE family n=1 Tax=Desulfofarcimen acetoxidans (strain ATCC 49208 / DSM 771 / KCTC 5769 / VKM B-1644 / 5575) TaxID=485916 RepID=C8W134_DESAS|nr:helix-turn-helix transcriptional regulator [Desulfofarcimen acetoxidans]ACV63430.1 transcriptional regulator, XRE family [Desulfofarcimen acetoxidans DSM 771]
MDIKDYRQKKGYTQEEVARLLDITLRYYQNIERGKQKPNVIIGLNLALILKVNPFKLWKIKDAK